MSSHLPGNMHRSRNKLNVWHISLVCLLASAKVFSPMAFSQDISSKDLETIVIRGIVLSADGKPAMGAEVQLEQVEAKSHKQNQTGKEGVFEFSIRRAGNYSLSAKGHGQYSRAFTLSLPTSESATKIVLVLDQAVPAAETSSSAKISTTSTEAMQFADQPNFTVAGITDFTAAGGHGSDVSLRTSEALAAETSTLKAGASGRPEANRVTSRPAADLSEENLRAAAAHTPNSFEANHQLGEFYFHAGRYREAVSWLEVAYRINRGDRKNEYDLALACKAIGDPSHSSKYAHELLNQQGDADVYRLAAEVDEATGNSLESVREYQRAVGLDPSERNFFEWGSELLLHRAIWQAEQVFQEGVKAHPESARMLTGLGTALFSGAVYDEAAAKLCKASDLEPRQQEPYIFLGKVQMAAPNRLECVEPRLKRFLAQQPENADANYLYAMALLKDKEHGPNQQQEQFLKKAVAINPNYSEALLQLGILRASRREFGDAIELYKKAIEKDPKLSDAYYRLAVAYDRTGLPEKAKEQFRLHDDIMKQQAKEIEQQRQEIKQFLVVLPGQPNHAPTP